MVFIGTLTSITQPLHVHFSLANDPAVGLLTLMFTSRSDRTRMQFAGAAVYTADRKILGSAACMAQNWPNDIRRPTGMMDMEVGQACLLSDLGPVMEALCRSADADIGVTLHDHHQNKLFFWRAARYGDMRMTLKSMPGHPVFGFDDSNLLPDRLTRKLAS